MAAEWETEGNIAQVKRLYANGLGAKGIGNAIGVSKGTISGWLNRANLCRDDPLIAAPRISNFWCGVAPAWLTAQADELFRILWDAGVKTAEIQEFFDITQEQRRSRREKLGLVARDPKASVRKRAPQEEINRRLASPNGGKQTSFTGVTWCAVTLPALPSRVAGVCQWPLSCSEAAARRFCDHHVGLIGLRVR
jgi:transposase